MRAKAGRDRGGTIQIQKGQTPSPAHPCRLWAALIKQVWRVDPLVCPRCHGRLKIVSFITPAQPHVIEKILRHRGLWDESPRAPPHDDHAAPRQPDSGQLRYVSDLEFVDAAPPDPVWTPD